MNAHDPSLSELIQRCAHQAYVAHGEMLTEEEADGCVAREVPEPVDDAYEEPSEESLRATYNIPEDEIGKDWDDPEFLAGASWAKEEAKRDRQGERKPEPPPVILNPVMTAYDFPKGNFSWRQT